MADTTDTTPLSDRADAFVASMDRTERVTWLKHQGVTDLQILDALLDRDDPELDDFTRDQAQDIAVAVADGELTAVPGWLI